MITLNSDYQPNVHPHLMEQIQEFNGQRVHRVMQGYDRHHEYDYDTSSSSSMSPEAPAYPIRKTKEMPPPPLSATLRHRGSRQDLPQLDTLSRPSAPAPTFHSPISSQSSYWGTPVISHSNQHRLNSATDAHNSDFYSQSNVRKQHYDSHPHQSMDYDVSPSTYRDSESPPSGHRGMAAVAPGPSQYSRRPSIVEIQYPNPVNMGYVSSEQLQYPPQTSSSLRGHDAKPIDSTAFVAGGMPAAVPQHFGPPYRQQQQFYDQQSYYTPGGSMGGLAATDNGLQETWQTFMSQASRNPLGSIPLKLIHSARLGGVPNCFKLDFLESLGPFTCTIILLPSVESRTTSL